jgi:hypothetical protein
MLEIISYMLGMILIMASTAIIVYARRLGYPALVFMGFVMIVAAIVAMGAAYNHARSIDDAARQIVSGQQVNPTCLDANMQDTPC